MSRARGIVARYGQCADTERGYGALGRVYQSLAKNRQLSVSQCDGVAPRGRAALDGKTVRRQRVATVRQPSAAPILSIRNGSHAAGGTSPAWYVRRFCPSRSPASAVAYLSTLRYVAQRYQWVGGFVPSGVFAWIGSHPANEPACPAYRPVGSVERDDAAQANVPRSPIPPAAGPRATTYNPRLGGSPWTNEPAPKPRESARERSGRVLGVSDRRKGAIALYGALTRSDGVSRETGVRFGTECALSPREWPVQRDVGVPGCRTAPSKRGGHSAALSVAVGHLP